MRRSLTLFLSLGITLFFVSFIWQLAEGELVVFLGRVLYSFTNRSFIEVETLDSAGVPMRYYPKIGVFYDPKLIADEASRMYNTRIAVGRQERFELLSNWLIQHMDANGLVSRYSPRDVVDNGGILEYLDENELVPQQDNFAKADLTKPWYSTPAQTATMVALAKRAGQTRDTEILAKARNILYQVGDTDTGRLSRLEADSTLWLSSNPGYSLSGMLHSLLDLEEYASLVKDPYAMELLQRGTKALQVQLPYQEKSGYLHDEYLYLGIRAGHSYLTSLLVELNAKLPGYPFNGAIKRYDTADRAFIFKQLMVRPSLGRFSSFFITWFLLFGIAYCSLRVPKKKRIRKSGT